MRLNRNLLWPAAALLFAAAVLPFLVYYTGTQTLGPYSKGGPLQFVGDFYASLAHLRGAAWTLLLGPAALVAFWRGPRRVRVAKGIPERPRNEA